VADKTTAEECAEILRQLGFVDPARAVREHRGSLEELLWRARATLENKRW
jgi:hypothetical protein